MEGSLDSKPKFLYGYFKVNKAKQLKFRLHPESPTPQAQFISAPKRKTGI